MTEELQELGLKIGHRRIGRLMRENDIKIVRTQKYKATTDSNHTFNIMPNLLDQDFSTDGPNQKWAGDISYIWTSEGWLYLAVILSVLTARNRLDPCRACCANPAGQGSATALKGIWQSARWIWQWHCDSRRRIVFIIQIAVRNIVPTNINDAFPNMASRSR